MSSQQSTKKPSAQKLMRKNKQLVMQELFRILKHQEEHDQVMTEPNLNRAVQLSQLLQAMSELDITKCTDFDPKDNDPY